MTIKVGDKIPSATLMEMQDGKPTPVSTDSFFAGKKVAVFALPGAFTPTCSAKHVPGFVANHGALKAKGVDAIACISVNDAFVMGAWGKDQNAGDKVHMLADGNGDFTRALGLEFDASKFGMGKRSQRYSMIVDKGVVKSVNVEEPGAYRSVQRRISAELRPVAVISRARDRSRAPVAPPAHSPDGLNGPPPRSSGSGGAPWPRPAPATGLHS